MSAMNKKSGRNLDFEFKLKTLDSGDLFPQPPGRQMVEFERLANSLIAMQRGQTGVSITFTSSVSGEGNSYVSFNVARHLSIILDLRVAWIDANFVSPLRKPIDCPVDFRSLLVEPELTDKLQGQGQMVVIPNGTKHIKQTDILLSDKYPALLERLSADFAFTIIDAPPISRSIDVGHIAKHTTGMVLVVETRKLKHEMIRHNVDEMRNQGVNVIGSVLNKRTFDIPAFLYRRLVGV